MPQRWITYEILSLIQRRLQRRLSKYRAMRGAAKYDPKYKDSKDPSPVDMVSLWSIENQLHWQLDVSFGEDNSKRIGNAALNMSVINKTALSILKRYKDATNSKKSMKSLMRRACMNSSLLLEILDKAVWNWTLWNLFH